MNKVLITSCFIFLFLTLPSLVLAETGWIDLIEDPNAGYSTPNLPKPDYLETIIDPIFGTKITRITGDPGTSIPNVSGGIWGNVARHFYSVVSPWNADDSLIYLHINTEGGTPTQGHLFLDGQTYEVLFRRVVPRESRWHPTNPDLMIFTGQSSNSYAYGTKLGLVNVRTGNTTVLRDFSNEYSKIKIGPGKGKPSNDGRMIVLYASKLSGGHEIFAYDLVNDIKYPTLSVSSQSQARESQFKWANISSKGNYIFVKRDTTYAQIFDLNMNLVATLDIVFSHEDFGIDSAGEEVVVGGSGSVIIGETLFDSGYKGAVVMIRLRDGLVTQLTPKFYRSHTTARNTNYPGWSYNWYTAFVSSPFPDEIVAVKLDSNYQVRRFGHVHSTGFDTRRNYITEAHPASSRDGRRVIFASPWDSSTGRPVGAYIVDARAPGSGGTPAPTSTPVSTPSPALTPTPVATLPPASSFSIPKTVSAPVIDGSLDDFDQAQAAEFSFGSSGNLGGNTAMVKALWDSQALYLGYEVLDTQLNANITTRDGNVWTDDAIEWFVDTLGDDGGTGTTGRYMLVDDYQGIVNLNNAQYDGQGTGTATAAPDAGWNGNWQSAVQTIGSLNNNTDTDTGYTIELKLPWTSLGFSSPPTENTQLRLGLAFEDKDSSTHTFLMYPDITTAFANASKWTPVTLSADSTPTPSVCDSLDFDQDQTIGLGDLFYVLSHWSSNSLTQLLEVLGSWGLRC